ncbi:VOC family protein [Sphingobium sp. CAP-1]|uniref:VOC family protein n=1 Tax=Sphingobium sp. CAP-1 TaxID=2676077 RepID=UPI0012BB2752|nr:VOC family protein [Sphingobium sp. CAP-1]QGP81111.1 hypothetical protein GL174_18890 [Sphingobium sp. CAP-1]
MGARAFSFTKIVVADLDRAVSFYRDAIGLKLLSRFVAAGGDYAQEEAVMAARGRRDGPLLMLIRYLERPVPPPGAAWTGFAVDDLRATIDRVRKAGGKVVVPTHDLPQYAIRVAVVADPHGHLIELTTPLDKVGADGGGGGELC